jgi:hypothetical protein
MQKKSRAPDPLTYHVMYLMSDRPQVKRHLAQSHFGPTREIESAGPSLLPQIKPPYAARCGGQNFLRAVSG